MSKSYENICLMLLAGQNILIPVHDIAFKVAQNSKRKLNKKYRYAVVVRSDGVIQKIESIDLLGLNGESLFNYVEFDVPVNRVLPRSNGTGRIPGPNSPNAKVPGRNPSNYKMPPATNIRVLNGK